MRVTEIFYSIQGESTHTGRRCIFIRLTGCNLRCVWCDSEYTFTGGTRMEVPEILDAISKYDCRLVEVTGGEPLLQKDSFELIRQLCERGYEVLIETSGSIDIGKVDPRATIIMDLKCPGSGEVGANLWSNIEKLKPQDEIKFVIAGRGDYEWAREVIAKYDLGRFTLLFSTTFGSLPMKDLAEWMLADSIPARLQTQLHKHIWGPDVHGV